MLIISHIAVEFRTFLFSLSCSVSIVLLLIPETSQSIVILQQVLFGILA